MKVFNLSPGKKALVRSTKEELKNFLVKIEGFLKEMDIKDEENSNIISLIEPIVEACQGMSSKFSNCTELKGKIAIMASVSGKAMMIFLGMLNEIMEKGDLAVQNKELLSKVVKRIKNVKVCVV